MSINVVTLSGTLARELQISYQGKRAVTRLDVCCTYMQRDGQGEWRKECNIVPVYVTNDKAERIAGWYREGAAVEIVGKVEGVEIQTPTGKARSCAVIASSVYRSEK